MMAVANHNVGAGRHQRRIGTQFGKHVIARVVSGKVRVPCSSLTVTQPFPSSIVVTLMILSATPTDTCTSAAKAAVVARGWLPTTA
jgi:hypothetical protein